jgi:hypothetical protein
MLEEVGPGEFHARLRNLPWARANSDPRAGIVRQREPLAFVLPVGRRCPATAGSSDPGSVEPEIRVQRITSCTGRRLDVPVTSSTASQARARLGEEPGGRFRRTPGNPPPARPGRSAP